MFSFFRKAQTGAKPVIPNDVKLSEAVEGASPIPSTAMAKIPSPDSEAKQVNHSTADDGIQVYEMELQTDPAIEEAVMLYANGQTGAATAALNRYILDHTDCRDSQPWLLLFDIYEATGQRLPFDDLAVDYAVRFEHSPPTWRSVQSAVTDKTAQKHPTFTFGPTIAPQDKPRLEHFYQECELADTATLDFSKTPVPGDDSYARQILETLSRVIAMGKEVQMVGGEAFVVRLNASRIAGVLTESTWLLLLMLLQLQAKRYEFEEVAVGFAIQFEISPPSYTPPKHISMEPGTPEPELTPKGHTFPLKGLLGPNSTNVFNDLREFAEPLSVIEIDLSQVTRIDFSIIGLLMDTIMSPALAGKRILFRGGNTMVNLLLQMIGIEHFATIQQEKRK
jgi:ABC-type transporter Mla MlaB component